MPKLALYLKWRPQRFEEVVGQPQVNRALQNSLRAGRIRHAYLFSGPRGTGKTTTARLLAKAINCTAEDVPCCECPNCLALQEGRFLDLIEIDAATHTGVDDVRELREKIVFAPSEGRYKVYIIDEVHRFSGNAFDALLKTLEEPPGHAVFVLATTEVERVPATIQSRCLHFAFRRVSQQEILKQLVKIAEAEGFSYEENALALIARQGNGSVRDSISLLDQLLSDPDEKLTLEFVRSMTGTGNPEFVHSILEAILIADVRSGLQTIQDALDQGADPRQLCQQIVEQLRRYLLLQAGTLQPSEEERDRNSKEWPQRRLLFALSAFSAAANQLRRSWQAQLELELAFLKCIEHHEVETVRQHERDARHSPSDRTPKVPERARSSSTKRAVADHSPEGAKESKLSILMIQDKWPELLQITSKINPGVTQLLRQIETMELKANTLRLFTKPLFLEKWGDGKKKAALQRGLAELISDGLHLEFVDSTNMEEKARINGGEVNPLEDLLPIARELGGEIVNRDSDR